MDSSNRFQEAILEGHNLKINSIAITHDNLYAITTGQDRTLKIWNLVNKTPENVLRGHTRDVFCVAITKNNAYAVSGA
jgi:WD40 repeat protein